MSESATKRLMYYSLLSANPSLAAQWHPTKNGSRIPSDVKPYSNKKAWWRCGKGHQWEATIASRTGGRGCPYCAGQAVCEDNCLQTVAPLLAAQWHLTKNGGRTPSDVIPHSSKKAWWRCNSGHEWQASIKSRMEGRGCPYCARMRRHTLAGGQWQCLMGREL